MATHISEDMDRLTDSFGQCTICISIPSDLYELHNLATEVLGHDLLQCLSELSSGVSMKTHSAIHRRSVDYPRNNFLSLEFAMGSDIKTQKM